MAEGENLSLSKLLLARRGQEVQRSMKTVNAFRTTPGQPVAVTVTEKGGGEGPLSLTGAETLTQTQWNVCSGLFKWEECELALTPKLASTWFGGSWQGGTGGRTGETEPLVIKSTSQLQMLVETTRSREEVRKLDVLEASLESIRSMLLCSRAELHLRGCISLWRIAAKREQHPSMGDSVFALLTKVLRSDDPHVAVIGAAAVWCLAQEEATLRRLPVVYLVKALLHTYPTDRLGTPATPANAPTASSAGLDADPDADVADAASSDGDDDGDDGDTDGGGGGSASSDGAADAEFRNHAEIVYTATGKRLDELQHLPIRALHALLKSERGRQAFHRTQARPPPVRPSAPPAIPSLSARPPRPPLLPRPLSDHSPPVRPPRVRYAPGLSAAHPAALLRGRQRLLRRLPPPRARDRPLAVDLCLDALWWRGEGSRRLGRRHRG